MVFWWDNFGWGEIGCYGGGVLRGAPTPRIDRIADQGLKLLNLNVEAQCTPSRSAILTGRHAIRSRTGAVPIEPPDGLTRWEVTTAQALSDAGYATGMWGKWHLGSDPENRSPVDFRFDEAVWCSRTADEVLWSMQSYFPNGTVTSAPYAGPMQIPLELQPPRRAGQQLQSELGAGIEQMLAVVQHQQQQPRRAQPVGQRLQQRHAAGLPHPVTEPVCHRGGQLHGQPGLPPPRPARSA